MLYTCTQFASFFLNALLLYDQYGHASYKKNPVAMGQKLC